MNKIPKLTAALTVAEIACRKAHEALAAEIIANAPWKVGDYVTAMNWKGKRKIWWVKKVSMSKILSSKYHATAYIYPVTKAGVHASGAIVIHDTKASYRTHCHLVIPAEQIERLLKGNTPYVES